MAKVTLGVIVADIKGSIGGVTFQNNRSGLIIRARSGPRKTTSAKQTLAHQDHISAIQSFQALTLAEKTLWNDFAAVNTKVNRFGQVRELTGQNWFETIKLNRALFGLPQLDVPPVATLAIAVPPYTLVVDQTKIEVTFSPAFDPADNGLYIFTTYPLTRTTTNFRRALRKSKVITSGPFGTIDLTADWEATHGIPYPPSSAINCFNVGVLIQTINKTSGIPSPGLIEIGGTDSVPSGIGAMQIGTTFVVSPGGIGFMEIGKTFMVR
ncbi:MAG: hypothetical protein V3T88_08660 [Nitrosomonadaceae bacterium]